MFPDYVLFRCWCVLNLPVHVDNCAILPCFLILSGDTFTAMAREYGRMLPTFSERGPVDQSE